MPQRKRRRLLIMGGGETEAPVEPLRNGDEPSGVGALLRAERMRNRSELRDVAGALRIRLPYLEAIEEGRFDDLPGAVYAAGFVRAYARYLGLNQNDVLRRFKSEAAGANRSTELVFPAPLPEGRLPNGAILLVSLIVAVAAYGGWYYLSSLEEAAGGLRTPAVPTRLSTASREAPALAALEPPAAVASSAAATKVPSPRPMISEAPAPIPTPTPAPPMAAIPASPPEIPPAPPVMMPPASIPAPPPPALALVPPPPPLTKPLPPLPLTDSTGIPAAPESVTGAGPRLYGEVTADSRVLIRATAESWIQVHDAGGTILFTRTMKQGDSYMVPSRPGLILYTGNAGALDILVDGRRAPPIGRPGFVRRDVALDPARLLNGTALPETGRAPGGRDAGG